MHDISELFETTRCACLASRRAARRITRRYDHALRGLGLRSTQFTLLAALCLQGPQNIGALAELLDAERSTVSRNLAVIEKKGLLQLCADPDDARNRIAWLTDRGRTTLQRAFPIWRQVQHAIRAEIGNEALHGLHKLAGGPCVVPLPAPPGAAKENMA